MQMFENFNLALDPQRSNVRKEVAVLSESGANGQVFKYTLTAWDKQRKVTALALVKKNTNPFADNSIYEFTVGQVINRWCAVFPTFVYTYNLFDPTLKAKDLTLKSACANETNYMLVTEFVDQGETLEAFLKREQDQTELDKIGFQIAYPLVKLGTQFRHNDLQPANIMLQKHPEPILFTYVMPDTSVVQFVSDVVVRFVDYGAATVEVKDFSSSTIYKTICTNKACAEKVEAYVKKNIETVTRERAFRKNEAAYQLWRKIAAAAAEPENAAKKEIRDNALNDGKYDDLEHYMAINFSQTERFRAQFDKYTALEKELKYCSAAGAEMEQFVSIRSENSDPVEFKQEWIKALTCGGVAGFCRLKESVNLDNNDFHDSAKALNVRLEIPEIMLELFARKIRETQSEVKPNMVLTVDGVRPYTLVKNAPQGGKRASRKRGGMRFRENCNSSPLSTLRPLTIQAEPGDEDEDEGEDEAKKKSLELLD